MGRKMTNRYIVKNMRGYTNPYFVIDTTNSHALTVLQYTNEDEALQLRDLLNMGHHSDYAIPAVRNNIILVHVGDTVIFTKNPGLNLKLSGTECEIISIVRQDTSIGNKDTVCILRIVDEKHSYCGQEFAVVGEAHISQKLKLCIRVETPVSGVVRHIEVPVMVDPLWAYPENTD